MMDALTKDWDLNVVPCSVEAVTGWRKPVPAVVPLSRTHPDITTP